MPSQQLPLLKAPASLVQLQDWFAKVITRPLVNFTDSAPHTVDGTLLVYEAPRYIVPSHTLQPHERAELYNQQYWWRILDVLQSDYPCLTRLFGKAEFNDRIATPYFHQNPPASWCLREIVSGLPQWLEDNYCDDDKDVIVRIAKLDLAILYGFSGESVEPWRTELNETALQQKLKLQPFLTLFAFDADWIGFRDAMLAQEDADYWLDHDFPELVRFDKTRYFLIGRDKDLDSAKWDLSHGEYAFLSFIQGGASFDEACERAERDPTLSREVEQGLGGWIPQWLQVGWLIPF